ncbi:MAG: SDR family NAD(P)-dependent oxidoreductase [Thermodesulfobacteriota bacterium]
MEKSFRDDVLGRPRDLLKGQVALVTGASSGIGQAIAKALALSGARVVVNFSSNEEAANDVVQHIRNDCGEAIAVRANVSKEDHVLAMFETIFKEYGTIDILVNNAGVQKDAKFIDMTLDQWQLVLDINLTGQFLCAREAAKEFIRRGVVPERSVGVKGRLTMKNDKVQSSNKCQVANRRSLKTSFFAAQKLFHERKPLSLRSNASKVILSESRGILTPSCSPSMATALLRQITLKDNGFLQKPRKIENEKILTPLLQKC